jgi:predicted transcriptional regulator
MTLTVRLAQQLEEALDAYISRSGLTKSHVVQEALAEYLVHVEADTEDRARVSESFRAFEKAGLIGSVSGMKGESATKDVVRKRVLESLKSRR